VRGSEGERQARAAARSRLLQLWGGGAGVGASNLQPR
jgi:hypothetical protein